MKQLNTVCKEAQKLNYNDFVELITLEEAREYFASFVNAESFTETISENERFALAIYKELAKALDVKSKDKKQSYKLELDCNYEKSRMHDNDKYLLDYFSLVTSDRDRAIQIYLTCNAKKEKAYFRFCTSCKKVTREQFIDMSEKAKFTINYDKKTNRAKTSERKLIAYDEVVEVAKLVLAILNNEFATEKESND